MSVWTRSRRRRAAQALAGLPGLLGAAVLLAAGLLGLLLLASLPDPAFDAVAILTAAGGAGLILRSGGRRR